MLLSGNDLIEDINQAEPAPDSVNIWWLGQHSFVLKTSALTIYIDPFLSDHGKRMLPPLLDADQITNADLIVGTHNHRDHIDKEVWPSLAAASPQCQFLIPAYHRQALLEELAMDESRLKGINAGETFQLNDVTLHAVPAAHELLDRDEETGLYPFLGFVYEVGKTTLYHPGDCCLYDGQLQALEPFDIDIALLPINGRDAVRLKGGCIGNMTFQEAADLAGSLDVKLTIPTHYDMFAGNRENPASFTEFVKVKYPAINAIIARYGETITFPQ